MHINFNQAAPRAPDRPPDLMLFGDPHGDFEPVVSAVCKLQPKAIILLGDLTPARPLHIELAQILDATEVWFIHGNHDTDSEDDWLNISDRLVGTSLERRNLHGCVADIGGKKVAGLGGIFRGAAWMPSPESRLVDREDVGWHAPADMRRHETPAQRLRNGLSLRHRSTIFPSEVDALVLKRADILVSHEAPRLPHTEFDDRFHHGFTVVNDLADRMCVQLAVHGHHHDNIDYQRARQPGSQRWRAFGVDKGSCLIVHF